MPTPDDKPSKLYYSISEVAAMFGLNESTLRFWEQEFACLRPKTSGPGRVRQYTAKDIGQVRTIHNLVKVRGFKLAAAKKILAADRHAADRTAEILERLIGVRDTLAAMKRELEES